ncbi:MAG: tryptophan-rich sensory protein [Clostridia bacterium]|nr:tryptophan-rich sensory protein [Clostridia bacterium]
MNVTSNIRWKELIVSAAVPLAAGGISSLITADGFREYAAVTKPPLSPPAWLFPVVWTVLYILMGVSAYLIYNGGKIPEKSKKPLTVYAIQLAMNFMWPIFFFSLDAYLFSFIWLLAMWVLVLVMTVMFYRVNRLAGLLQIPYLVWLTFAAYLNLSVYILN